MVKNPISDDNKWKYSSAALRNLFIILSALVFLYSCIDFSRLVNTFWNPGWDFMTTCDGAFAGVSGRDAFDTSTYEFSKNPYTYSPIFVEPIAQICRAMGVADVHKVYAYFPYFWLLLVAVIFVSYKISAIKDDFFGFFFVIIAAFGGVLWVVRTGNLTLLEAAFLCLSLAFLVRDINKKRDSRNFVFFCIFFALFCGVKNVYFVFSIFFIFLPYSLLQRIVGAIVVVGLSTLPQLVSFVFLHDQFLRQIRNIEDTQISCSPNVVCLFDRLLQGGEVLPAIIVACSIVVCALAIVRIALSYHSNPRALKDSVSDVVKVQIFLFSMAISLAVLPRFKEYSFSLEAVLLAFLLSLRGRIDYVAISSVVICILPVLFLHPVILPVLTGFSGRIHAAIFSF